MENQVQELGNGIIIITTKAPKKKRIIPEPQKFWANPMNDNQRSLFICSLDDLDKDSTRQTIVPKRPIA
jgi:hypothetical protein